MKTDFFVVVGVNDQNYRFNERWDGDDPALLARAVCEIREGLVAEFGSIQNLSVDEERAEDINEHLFKMQEAPDVKIITLRTERFVGKNGPVDTSTDMMLYTFGGETNRVKTRQRATIAVALIVFVVRMRLSFI